MNVSITAPVFDLEGLVQLANVSQGGILGFERRNSRIATLDGGARISDFGYSDSDRTLDIRWPVKGKEQIEQIRRLAKSYSRVIVATDEGCFVGAPGPFSINEDEAQIQILVERKVSE